MNKILLALCLLTLAGCDATPIEKNDSAWKVGNVSSALSGYETPWGRCIVLYQRAITCEWKDGSHD